MSKGSSENLIKYLFFYPLRCENIDQEGYIIIISKFSSETQKNSYTCNGTVLVVLLHFSLQLSAEKFKNYNSWVWALLVILLPLLIVMVVYCYYLLLLLLLLFVIRPVLQLPHTTANRQNSLRFCFCFIFLIIFVACGNRQLFIMPPLVCFLRKQKFHTDDMSLPRSR